MLDLLTIGSALRDIVFHTDQTKIIETPKDLLRQRLIAVEYGAKIHSEKVALSFGGGGLNAAVNFSRLGFKTGILCALGDDALASELLRHMRTHRVDPRFVQRVRHQPSGFSFVLVDAPSHEHAAFVRYGSLTHLRWKFTNPPARWIYLTSLVGSQTREVIAGIDAWAKKGKVQWAWNPGGQQLREGRRGLRAVLKHVTVLNINEDEALELILSDSESARQYKSLSRRTPAWKFLAQTLQIWGPKMVLLTRGAKGAVVAEEKKMTTIGTQSVKRVDTTGAGDCYGSSFIAGLIHFSGDVPRALALADAQTSFLLQHIGAHEGLKTFQQLKNKL